MRSFDTITDARKAIRKFNDDALPEHMRERFDTIASSPSPVDQIVKLGEFLYANRDQIDDDATELAGGLIQYATLNAWHGLADDARGDRIVQAIRRDLGEPAPNGVEWPDAASDPQPQPQHVMVPPALEAPQGTA